MTMPAPYSYDLRQKAIEAVKRGERKIKCMQNAQHQSQSIGSVVKTGRKNGGLPSDYRL